MTHEFGYCGVSATCEHCSSIKDAFVPIAGVLLYKHGELVQNAFPEQSPEEREIAMSHIKEEAGHFTFYLCPSCWDKQFLPG